MKIVGCGKRFAGVVGIALGALTFWCSTPTFSFVLQGVWKTYTSKKEVRDVVINNGVVWAATSGGMFSLVLADSSFQEFTTSEGLRTNDLSSITIDRSGTVWVGSSNGLLQAYSPSTHQWKYVTDIAGKPDPRKQINTMLAIGDTLYIGSEIGLSVYVISRNEFGITARNFGSSLEISGNVSSIALYRDSIWVGTLNGIAAAPRSHPNLNALTSWGVWQSGLPSNTVSSLAVFHSVLYAATALGLARYNGSSWVGVSGTIGKNVLRAIAQNDSMYCITPSELFTVDTLGSISSTATFSSVSSIAVENSRIAVGSLRDGVYIQRGNTWQALAPKGPPTNHIIGLAIDDRGVLWAGTGAANGEGFLRFDGKEWASYTAQLYPKLRGNEYYKVYIGQDNVKWVCSWGWGVALVGSYDSVVAQYNTSNGLRPTSCPGCDTTFVAVSAVATDREGKAWIVIFHDRVGNTTTFAVLNPDGRFSYVTSPLGAVASFRDVIIDGFGTKWMANSHPTLPYSTGLYFYNERGFPGNDTVKWGRIAEEDGLSNNTIFTLAIDQSGYIWVGTKEGINIITNAYRLRPQLAPYVPLREQQINAIAVDPLNNKWIATNQGVFVLSPDGTSILTQYTVDSTYGKLVDNQIQSIAIDGNTGTVYFGSEKGLSTLTTSAVAPVRSYDELSIAPNPFYVPSSSIVTIDGLVRNSSLKILSIDGKLINEVKTPGGRVGYWDGTDLKGNYVSSGIYIIVAYSENGNQVAAGKVAVLRR